MSAEWQNNPASISVIVPVFNEETNLKSMYEELSATLSGLRDYQWELIFIDDGSTDQSVEQILAFRREDARIKLLRLSRNFGSHAALSAGLRYASGRAAIVLSADRQDPPNIIEEFLTKWREGYHIVCGIRQSRKDPLSKKLLAGIFYRFCRRTVLQNFPAGGVDCSLFDRRVIDEYLAIQERHSFLFATMLWMGFRQAYVPYDRRTRASGKSKWSFARRLQSAIDITVSFSYFPIRFASYLGLAISLVSFLYAVELIIERVVFGKGGSGWPSLMVTFLFLGGVQLIMIGILGEYIWHGVDQVKGRPRFIVMEEVGFEKKDEAETVSSNEK